MEKAVINAIVDEVVRRLARELKAEAEKPLGSSAPAMLAPGGSRTSADPSPTGRLRGSRWSHAARPSGRTSLSLPLPLEIAPAGDRRHARHQRGGWRRAQPAGPSSETGLGNVADKIKKNLLCADKTPGMEILEPKAVTGDHGLMLLERAPFGVIGAITPSTNPTETIINNGIGMVAGRQRRGLQRAPVGQGRVHVPRGASSTRPSSRPAARRSSSARWPSRPSSQPKR